MEAVGRSVSQSDGWLGRLLGFVFFNNVKVTPTLFNSTALKRSPRDVECKQNIPANQVFIFNFSIFETVKAKLLR